MRTTLDLDPIVLDQLRARQKREGKSLGQLASELLNQALACSPSPAEEPLNWPARDLQPLVNLDDKDAVAAALGDHDLG